MPLYARFQDTAKGLLGNFSQGTVKLVKITNSGDDWNPSQSETEHVQDAAVSGVSSEYVGMDTGGGVIVASDLQVLVPGGGQVPTNSDEYDIDGDRYQIVNVEPIPAAGTVSVYRVIVRK